MSTATATQTFNTNRVEVSTIIVAIFRTTKNYSAATELFTKAAAELGYAYGGPSSTFTTERANAIYAQAVAA